jgi:hypothetical protein
VNVAPDRPADPDARLATSALVAAGAGWLLIIIAALLATTRSGPVPDTVATDGVSTAVGLIGLVGAIGLIAGVGRGAVALNRARSGPAGVRTRAWWAVGLGAAPFVLVLALGVVGLVTAG